uniref:Uncharacterized protein n=1 Tax=Arundo donax TaxID=35708 RepID=A0A0A9F2P7_ARUDO
MPTKLEKISPKVHGTHAQAQKNHTCLANSSRGSNLL